MYVSRFRTPTTTLWTIVNRGAVDFTGHVIDADGRRAPVVDVTAGTALDGLGSRDHRAGAGHRRRAARGRRASRPASTELLAAARRRPAHAADATFPARLPVRVGAAAVDVEHAARRRHRAVRRAPTTVTVRYRLRETGMYDGAPFVEEWKPLPPRLHADVSEQHTVEIGPVAVACVEVLGDDGAALTGSSLAEARAYAASVGARLPTEFEWQLAAADPAFRRAEPLVWNWTESEHSDGITRFAILKGGCAYVAEGSEWYFDGGPRPPEFSAKLLLAGLGVDRSPSIGFRLAWDLDEGDDRG